MSYCQGCVDSERKLSCAAKTITELQKECNALREQLLLVRKILWLGHGHEGLYRDDGEMQCNIGGCMIDFKREPLEEIVANLLKQSVAQRDELRSQNAKLQSKLARQPLPLPPTYVRCMGGHYYAETRGDEECPTCEQLRALRERNAELMERNIQLAGSLKTTEDSRDRALERIADLQAQHELSGQAYLVVVNELRKTQAERDRALSELAEARKVIEAARCTRNNEGMIVSASHVRALWEALMQYDAARAAIPADDLASSEVERDADSPVSGAGRLGWGRIQRFAIDEAARLGHILGAFSRAAGRHPARFAMCETCLGSCWIALHPVRGMTAGGRLLKYRCGTHEAAGTLPISLAPETDPSTAEHTPAEAKAKGATDSPGDKP